MCILLNFLHFRLDPALLQPHGPILTEVEIDKLLDQDDFEAKAVLSKVNARKPIHAMVDPEMDFASETHYGLNAVIERGRLGLVASAA